LIQSIEDSKLKKAVERGAFVTVDPISIILEAELKVLNLEHLGQLKFSGRV